jgi:hypothetical protein
LTQTLRWRYLMLKCPLNPSGSNAKWSNKV